MARSLLAILVGYLTFGISAGLLFGLSGRDPYVVPAMGFLVFSIGYGVGFALLGGYLAATIARRRKVLHAAIVAAIIAVAALASIVAKAGSGSLWSPIAALC